MTLRERHVIDTFKGVTPLVVFALIARADAWERGDAWAYLAIHGTYGLFWVAKSRTFGDRSWERPLTASRGVLLAVGLTLYWLSPVMLLSRPDPAGPAWIAGCVALYAIGVFLHFSADMQKFMAMALRPGVLWTEGLWGRTRNPNYLGELCIYLAFALLSRHWAPFLVFGSVVAKEWVPNMRRKDASLSRYPAFAEWKGRTGMLFPRLFVARRG